MCIVNTVDWRSRLNISSATESFVRRARIEFHVRRGRRSESSASRDDAPSSGRGQAAGVRRSTCTSNATVGSAKDADRRTTGPQDGLGKPSRQAARQSASAAVRRQLRAPEYMGRHGETAVSPPGGCCEFGRRRKPAPRSRRKRRLDGSRRQ